MAVLLELQAADIVRETGHFRKYTLTKYMAEQLIAEYHNVKFPVCIVRPSVVGAIAGQPSPGYFGNTAGSTALFLAYGLGKVPALTGFCPRCDYAWSMSVHLNEQACVRACVLA